MEMMSVNYHLKQNKFESNSKTESINEIIKRKTILPDCIKSSHTNQDKYREHYMLSSLSYSALKRNEITKTVMNESYYDTENNDLMKKNYWLRLRDKKWTLKYEISNENGVIVFKERSEESSIIKKLMKLIPNRASETSIGDYCTQCIAQFTTYRYNLPQLETNFTLWVDVSIFEEEKFYILATIERPLLEKVEYIHCEKLRGVYCVSQPVQSKVIAYMYLHKKEMLKIVPQIECSNISFSDNDPFSYDSLALLAFYHPEMVKWWQVGEPLNFEKIRTKPIIKPVPVKYN